MRAIIADAHGGPEVMRLVERPDAEPGAEQARVRVHAAGVNFIDIYHRRGAYAIAPPVLLGLEGAGVVEAVGAGVHAVGVGDRVAWTQVPGSYATHVVAPADRLVPVPELVSLSDAAAVMTQGITAHYLSHSSYGLRPGDECLVHAGAGGVGSLLIQMAKRLGARVLTTVSTEEKAEAARAAGADEVIFYTREDFAVEVRRLTDGRGVRAVYDGVGKDTFERSLDSLMPRGFLILFGQSSGAVGPFDPQILNAKGSLYLQRPSIFHYVAERAELLERAGRVLEWVAEGGLRVRIGSVMPLEEAAEAHRALEGRGTIGKVILSTS
jgi:NADPH2:quinone reductase